MQSHLTLVGPVLYRQGGYGFDICTMAAGRHRSFSYRTIEEAIYDRRVMLRDDQTEDCCTIDAFERRADEMMPTLRRAA